MRRLQKGIPTAALVLAWVGMAGTGWALTLQPGDLIVVDNPEDPFAENAEPSALLRIDPTTGAAETISEGGSFEAPAAVAVHGSGDLLVTDFGAGRIFRVDPSDGSQSVFASLPSPFIDLDGVLVAPDGEVFATGGFDARVYRVGPGGGTATVLAEDELLMQPFGLLLDDQQDLIVADFGAAALIRVDPDDGSQSVVSAFGPDGSLLPGPVALSIEAGGDDLLVSELGLGAVVRVDPDTGAQSLVTAVAEFVAPAGIATEDADHVVLVETGSVLGGGGGPEPPGIYRVTLSSGAVDEVVMGDPLRLPSGIAVFAPEPGAFLALAAVAGALALRRRLRP